MHPMVNQLLQLWRTSSLVQGLMALLFAAAIVYLAVAQRPIPEALVGALMAVLGFYFGSKSRTSDSD